MRSSREKFNRGSVELKTKDIHAYREQITLFPRLSFASGTFIPPPPPPPTYTYTCNSIWYNTLLLLAAVRFSKTHYILWMVTLVGG
jgi:hypothetical protein